MGTLRPLTSEDIREADAAAHKRLKVGFEAKFEKLQAQLGEETPQQLEDRLAKKAEITKTMKSDFEPGDNGMLVPTPKLKVLDLDDLADIRGVLLELTERSLCTEEIQKSLGTVVEEFVDRSSFYTQAGPDAEKVLKDQPYLHLEAWEHVRKLKEIESPLTAYAEKLFVTGIKPLGVGIEGLSTKVTNAIEEGEKDSPKTGLEANHHYAMDGNDGFQEALDEAHRSDGEGVAHTRYVEYRGGSDGEESDEESSDGELSQRRLDGPVGGLSLTGGTPVIDLGPVVRRTKRRTAHQPTSIPNQYRRIRDHYCNVIRPLGANFAGNRGHTSAAEDDSLFERNELPLNEHSETLSKDVLDELRDAKGYKRLRRVCDELRSLSKKEILLPGFLSDVADMYDSAISELREEKRVAKPLLDQMRYILEAVKGIFDTTEARIVQRDEELEQLRKASETLDAARKFAERRLQLLKVQQDLVESGIEQFKINITEFKKRPDASSVENHQSASARAEATRNPHGPTLDIIEAIVRDNPTRACEEDIRIAYQKIISAAEEDAILHEASAGLKVVMERLVSSASGSFGAQTTKNALACMKQVLDIADQRRKQMKEKITWLNECLTNADSIEKKTIKRLETSLPQFKPVNALLLVNLYDRQGKVVNQRISLKERRDDLQKQVAHYKGVLDGITPSDNIHGTAGKST
ncbi:Uu.00g010940.m01.CDS01 [Anthostomella pinea]|uniref:Uu.00g010940.m01.CDS01 n=1 Tax=Anthostomella pinea TaxID=933095 RepID=A0AAI8VYK0_9PEZI|nr:Uu.00g010940.m01.CDS01 [Anthostomella pinea]